MCTLTLIREAGSLLVTMNRDDIAAREEAPPALWPHAQPAFVAPKDLQAGGTWIGVNADGVISCLLNRYDEAPLGVTSRGAIVLEAMRGKNFEDACDALASLDHSLYSPFTCIVADRGSAARIDWTGAIFERTALTTESDVMLTSSSWQFAEVSARREALFQKIWSRNKERAARVDAFHSARDSAHDAWAPMMQRPTSQTKSITQVELTTRGADMRYWTRASAISRRLSAPDTMVHLAACSPQLLEVKV